MHIKYNISHFFIILFAVLIVSNSNLAYSESDPPNKSKWIDLTHDFSEETIYWPTAQEFKLETVFSGFHRKRLFL